MFQVKTRREGLPPNVIEAQTTLEETVKRERKAAGLLDADKKRDGKVVQKKFRVIQFKEGKLAKISNVVQESFQDKSEGITVERTPGAEPGFGSGGMDDEDGYSGDMEDLDDIMGGGLDEVRRPARCDGGTAVN